MPPPKFVHRPGLRFRLAGCRDPTGQDRSGPSGVQHTICPVFQKDGYGAFDLSDAGAVACDKGVSRVLPRGRVDMLRDQIRKDPGIRRSEGKSTSKIRASRLVETKIVQGLSAREMESSFRQDGMANRGVGPL